MKKVTIRVELRVSEEMHDFLLSEAHSRKLSFEGLLLMYMEERLEASRQVQRHTRPARR